MAGDIFDSWEEGNFNKWLWIVGNDFDITNTDPLGRCGAVPPFNYNCIRTKGNGLSRSIYVALDSDPTVSWFRTYFRIVPHPDNPPAGVSGGVAWTVTLWDVGGSFAWDIDVYLVTGGATSPRFRLSDDDANTVDGTTSLNVNQWYCCDLRIEAQNGTATQRLYINGVLECTINDNTSGKTFYRFYYTSCEWTFAMDCRTAYDCFSYYKNDVTPPMCGSCQACQDWGAGYVGLCGGCDDLPIDVVLSWHEEEVTPIPIKNIIRKSTPTVQANYWHREPRKIELELKVTRTKKQALEDCKHLHGWNQLYDFDGEVIDWVWIESLSWRWAGNEDHNYPWRGKLVLICSGT